MTTRKRRKTKQKKSTLSNTELLNDTANDVNVPAFKCHYFPRDKLNTRFNTISGFFFFLNKKKVVVRYLVANWTSDRACVQVRSRIGTDATVWIIRRCQSREEEGKKKHQKAGKNAKKSATLGNNWRAPALRSSQLWSTVAATKNATRPRREGK